MSHVTTLSCKHYLIKKRMVVNWSSPVAPSPKTYFIPKRMVVIARCLSLATGRCTFPHIPIESSKGSNIYIIWAQAIRSISALSYFKKSNLNSNFEKLDLNRIKPELVITMNVLVTSLRKTYSDRAMNSPLR